jgi:hypothetical protein
VSNGACRTDVGHYDVGVTVALRNEIGHALEHGIRPYRVDAIHRECDILLDHANRLPCCA